MKTLHLKAVVLTFIIGIMMFSFSAKADTNQSELIKSSIAKYLTYPDFAKENSLSGDVTVMFSVDENGTVILKSAISENEELALYVKENFSKIDFTDAKLKTGTMYRIVVTFQIY